MDTIDQIVDTVLRDYAIDGVVKYKDEDYAIVNDDELTFHIVFIEKFLTHCISVDHRKCYNKVSQCPIHFTIGLSRRKNNRLHQALKFLRTEEGAKQSATFNWNGYDEFAHHVRDEFYHNSH